jgi:hypothetical protein
MEAEEEEDNSFYSTFIIHPSLEQLVRWMVSLLEYIHAQPSLYTSEIRPGKVDAVWWSKEALPIWQKAQLNGFRKPVLTFRMSKNDSYYDYVDKEMQSECPCPEWFANEYVATYFLRASALCTHLETYLLKEPSREPELSGMTHFTESCITAAAFHMHRDAIPFLSLEWPYGDDDAVNEYEFTMPVLWDVSQGREIQNLLRRSHSFVHTLEACDLIDDRTLLDTDERRSTYMLTEFLAASHPEIFQCHSLLRPQVNYNIRQSLSPRYDQYTCLSFLQTVTFLACMDEFLLLFVMRLVVRSQLSMWKTFSDIAADSPHPKPLFWLLIACIVDDDVSRFNDAMTKWKNRIEREAVPYRADEIPTLTKSTPGLGTNNTMDSLDDNPIRRSVSNDSLFDEQLHQNPLSVSTPPPSSAAQLRKKTQLPAPSMDVVIETEEDDETINGMPTAVIIKQSSDINNLSSDLAKFLAGMEEEITVQTSRSSSSSSSDGSLSAQTSSGETSPERSVSPLPSARVHHSKRSSKRSLLARAKSTHHDPSITIASLEKPNIAILGQYTRLVFCAIRNNSNLCLNELRSSAYAVLWEQVSFGDRLLSTLDIELPGITIEKLKSLYGFTS